MKKHRLRNFKSIQEFKESINKTSVFIHGLESTIAATEVVLDFTEAKHSPEYGKYKNFLEFDDIKKSYLYELGFVALFSNFEFFMPNFLKELFLRYPNSIKSEKNVSLEEIVDFKNIKDIREYFADIIATEKSYDVKSWVDFLSKKFNIKVFKTKKQLQRFLMLNALRNLYMHSGGITNAKFRKEMKNFLKTRVPLGQRVGLDRRQYFEILHHELHLILKGLQLYA